MARLDSFANELLCHIFSFLQPFDLVSPMRVNKSFHGLIEPMIWTKLELHGPGFHEYYQYPEELVDSESRQKRNYLATGTDYNPDHHEREYSDHTGRFLRVFNESEEGVSPVRRMALAEHVRFLCADLTYDDEDDTDPWGIIAGFSNLEHLELTVPWAWRDTFDTAFEAFMLKEHRPLTKLHTVRLRGYVPKEFVQFVCQGAAGITDLELAVLDRPIGSNNYAGKRINPPPGTKTKVDSDDEDSASDGESEDDDAEDFDEEAIAPRGLPVLLDKIDLIGQFSSLTRLSLARPTQSAEDADYRDEYVSVKSDVAILQEWAAVIRATRGTLEHLILEQRPFAEEIEQDSTGDREFLVLYPYGPGYDRFVEHTLPALLEEGAEWPRLKSVRLYGFDVPAEYYSDDSDQTPEPQRLLAILEARFKPRGVEVRSGLGRRMIYEDDDGTIRSGGDDFGGIRFDLEDD
ncbi:hypothetical protein B0H14DRAFT_939060 [Mycena olivaceomarginata]|nr:hypothetical protein B0H14DRAFT_939060 [Mycena olivaceomarginata]